MAFVKYESIFQLNGNESLENLTAEDRAVFETWMERSDCRIVLKDANRHLIVQHMLIYYVFKRRIRQIEALAVSTTGYL
jgi:hypothetical protein